MVVASYKGGIWLLSEDRDIFFRKSLMISQWLPVKVPANAGELSHIAVGGFAVWLTASDGSVYVRDGVSDETPMGSEWLSVDGRLKMISVSPSGRVIGVNRAGSIYYRTGLSERNIKGESWKKLSGAASFVSCGDAALWALSPSKDIFFRAGIEPGIGSKNEWGTKWEKCDGKAALISAGSGTVYIVSDTGIVSRREGITVNDAKGTAWRPVDMKLSSICASGAYDTVISPSIYTGVGRGPGTHSKLPATCESVLKHKEDESSDSKVSDNKSIATMNQSGDSTFNFGGFGMDDFGWGGLGVNLMGMGAVMYTWQMVRRTIRLKRVLTKRKVIEKQRSPTIDNSTRFNSKNISPTSQARILRETSGVVKSSTLSENQLENTRILQHTEYEKLSETKEKTKELDVCISGLGPLSANGNGEEDDTCHWLVSFASNNCSHVTFQNVASGKFINFDSRIKLPHCNSTKANACPIKILSHPNDGCISLEFSTCPGALLAFQETGTAVLADLASDARGDLDENICVNFTVIVVK